ncbi:MAG: hypothetical protein Q4D90_01845, partial [bacterium]|nr:hypothetical protein [bacterium]
MLSKFDPLFLFFLCTSPIVAKKEKICNLLIDFFKKVCYNLDYSLAVEKNSQSGAWRSLVARTAGGREVAGSN